MVTVVMAEGDGYGGGASLSHASNILLFGEKKLQNKLIK